MKPSLERKETIAEVVSAVAGGAVGGVAGEASAKAPRPRESRPRNKKGAPKTEREDEDYIAEIKGLTGELTAMVVRNGVDTDLGRRVLGVAARYDLMLFRLVNRLERVGTMLEMYQSGEAGVSWGLPKVGAGGLPAGVTAPVIAPAPAIVFEPVESWSVVIKGKNGASSKEVLEKMKEVGPALDVRSLRPDRTKIEQNKKFKEVGLEVSVGVKLGPKVVV